MEIPSKIASLGAFAIALSACGGSSNETEPAV